MKIENGFFKVMSPINESPRRRATRYLKSNFSGSCRIIRRKQRGIDLKTAFGGLNDIFHTVAPKTFLMPISFVRRSEDVYE
jgi:hypothetical protein